MSNIDKHSVVSFHYTLRDADGNLLDQSEHQPLTYLHGNNAIIPGLEKALTGKAVGDRFTITIAPQDAYGEYHQEGVNTVPREQFKGVEDIQPGMQFEANANGQAMLVTVTKVEENSVTIDANHPLAGQTLTFDIHVVEVRSATAEEISHGHVHGAGGVHH